MVSALIGRIEREETYNAMPLGTEHVDMGMLLDTHEGVVLELGGGGRWRLKLSWWQRRFIGQHVKIKGVRIGFDKLKVVKIEPTRSDRLQCWR